MKIPRTARVSDSMTSWTVTRVLSVAIRTLPRITTEQKHDSGRISQDAYNDFCH